jgi:hypothetical protein
MREPSRRMWWSGSVNEPSQNFHGDRALTVADPEWGRDGPVAAPVMIRSLSRRCLGVG